MLNISNVLYLNVCSQPTSSSHLWSKKTLDVEDLGNRWLCFLVAHYARFLHCVYLENKCGLRRCTWCVMVKLTCQLYWLGSHLNGRIKYTSGAFWQAVVGWVFCPLAVAFLSGAAHLLYFSVTMHWRAFSPTPVQHASALEPSYQKPKPQNCEPNIAVTPVSHQYTMLVPGMGKLI